MRDIRTLIPNRQQPRKYFAEQQIVDLASSIKQFGLLQPIVVCAEDRSKSRFRIVAGERRYRACQRLGWEVVPTTEIEVGAEAEACISLIENTQRAQLTLLEEGAGYHQLSEKFGYTAERIGAIVGRDRNHVQYAIRALEMGPTARRGIESGRITLSHLKVLCSSELEPYRELLAQEICDQELSVRATENRAKSYLRGVAREDPAPLKQEIDGNPSGPSSDITYMESQLREYLATKTQIRGGIERGVIEITYFSGSELARILDLLLGQHP